MNIVKQRRTNEKNIIIIAIVAVIIVAAGLAITAITLLSKNKPAPS
jgi:flagellar basal body-associated protein FliL